MRRIVAPALSNCFSRLGCPSQGARGSVVGVVQSHSSLVVGTSARFASSAEEVSALQSRVKKLEETIESMQELETSEARYRYFAGLRLTNLKIDEVVRRCADPNYQPHIFTHQELPIMVAHMVRQLDLFPAGLAAMPASKTVRQILLHVLLQLSEAPMPDTQPSEVSFVSIVEKCIEEIDPVLTLMARAVLEVRMAATKHRRAIDEKAGRTFKRDEFNHEQRKSIQASLDTFNTILVKFKFLARQLCALPATRKAGTKYIGLVDTELDILNCVMGAMEEAREVCVEHFGDAPEVISVVPNGAENLGVFPHWGDSIQYCVKELGKNAFRATVEKHMKKDEVGIVSCADMPPVVVTIGGTADSGEYCSICISDEGGGIARKNMEKVMSYTFTTTKNPLLLSDEENDRYAETAGALAGYGYGLPMSAVYARCFDGDLQLHSMEGFGSRAFLHLRRKSFNW